jgi:hypothetical protein
MKNILAVIGSTLAVWTMLTGVAAHADAGSAYCSLPGELVADDATGDAAVIAAPDPIPGHDVKQVFIAEPASADGVDKIYFTLTVDSLGPAATPLSSYQVTFTTDDGVTRFALYTPYPTPVAVFSGQDLMFAYGHDEVGPGGTGNFVIDGAAEPESTASADGTITIVLKKTSLQLDEGGSLSSVAGVSQLNLEGAGTLDVDSSDSTGFYEVHNGGCAGSGKSGSGLLMGAGGLAPGALVVLLLAGWFRRRG